jgi:AraC family transcriptional regulator of adaptative response/methylated-DNA-[protein]-cysteine methyltransferase
MSSLIATPTAKTCPFATDDQRWRAVAERDPAADGAYVYAVKTTGVYCRPVCAARLALRKNVRFFDSSRQAESAGYRPCRRCRPNGERQPERYAALVARACQIISEAVATPRLNELARAVGVSSFHLHRIFKTQTGLTPRQYAAAHRAGRFREELPKSKSVTEAIYAAGYNSSSRVYESAIELLGMSPTEFRKRGCNMQIRFAVERCRLGQVLVAATAKGVCAILPGDSPDELIRELQDRFPQAAITGSDRKFKTLVSRVINFVENPSTGLDLPLDVRGTAFQQRVWNALAAIPVGSTATYSEIAARIGQPNAARAVAAACAANRLAIAIPCHRVVRADGSPSGYRWGERRKRELIRRERQFAKDERAQQQQQHGIVGKRPPKKARNGQVR